MRINMIITPPIEQHNIPKVEMILPSKQEEGNTNNKKKKYGKNRKTK